MAEYIEREALLQALEYNPKQRDRALKGSTFDIILNHTAADVVEVGKAAEMLYTAFGEDDCPCNYAMENWLPEVCELQDECPNPKEKLGCWKQYIKHFGERKEQ